MKNIRTKNGDSRNVSQPTLFVVTIAGVLVLRHDHANKALRYLMYCLIKAKLTFCAII